MILDIALGIVLAYFILGAIAVAVVGAVGLAKYILARRRAQAGCGACAPTQAERDFAERQLDLWRAAGCGAQKTE